METMAGEGEGCAQTQEGHQLETFVQGSTETLDGKRGTAPRELGQMSLKAKVCQHDPVKPPRRVPRVLLEVFSVKFTEFKKHKAQEEMHGCILIVSDFSYVVLDRIKKAAPLNIDDEGYVKLMGPNRVIHVDELVQFATHLFVYQPLDYQDAANAGFVMWSNNRKKRYDTLLTKSLESPFGRIVVSYAVYDDAAEAWLDVRVVACQFPAPAVYGTITARNSYLPKEATSVLFNRKRDEGISLDVVSDSDEGKYVHLPLSRRKTVHPYGSDVIISLDIKQCGNTEAEDLLIASDPELRFKTRLSGHEILPAGNGAYRVEVSVTWHEKSEPLSKAVF